MTPEELGEFGGVDGPDGTGEFRKGGGTFSDRPATQGRTGRGLAAD
jgi:hypothetical protein